MASKECVGQTNSPEPAKATVWVLPASCRGRGVGSTNLVLRQTLLEKGVWHALLDRCVDMDSISY